MRRVKSEFSLGYFSEEAITSAMDRFQGIHFLRCLSCGYFRLGAFSVSQFCTQVFEVVLPHLPPE